MDKKLGTRKKDSGKKGVVRQRSYVSGEKNTPEKMRRLFCHNSFSISKELFDWIYIWDNLIRKNVDENNTNYICGGKVMIK